MAELNDPRYGALARIQEQYPMFSDIEVRDLRDQGIQNGRKLEFTEAYDDRYDNPFIEIFDPSATDTVTHFLGRTAYNLGDAANQGAHSTCLVGGGSVGYAAVNYLKLYPSSGNFVTGEFTLYGRKI